jgi:hypothetical protein
VAEEQKQRTLVRIGELYLEQHQSDAMGVSQLESDNSSESESEQTCASSSHEGSCASSSHEPSAFYGGYNASYNGEIRVASQPSRTPDLHRGDHMTVDRASTVERNDAVTAIPNTGMRKNITMRRSQGRPRDRDSIGGTSQPVVSLLSKQHRPRDKDVNYEKEFVPRRARTPTKDQAVDESRSAAFPEFTRRHIPDKKDDPATYAALNSRWIEKKGVEEDMKQALHDHDMVAFHSLESRCKALNAQMFSVLQASISRQPESARPNPPEQMLMGRQRIQEAPVVMTGGCSYDSRSYVIYLEYQEHMIPWVVWAEMPTSLLVQAAVNALSSMGIEVSRDEVVLFHQNQPMEPNGGCLSDHPVLANDVVFIIVNPTQGRIYNRNGTKMEHSKSKRTMKKERDSTSGRVTPKRMQSVIGEINFRSDQRLLHQVDGFHDSNSPTDNHVRTGQSHLNLANRNMNRTMHEERNFSANVGHGEGSESPLNVSRSHDNLHGDSQERESPLNMSRSHDKIKQSFKCPRFSGQTKDWKLWNKGFLRFLSIWDLDYVVDPNFFEETPITESKIRDNKLVYYILEDATQGSPLASAYVRQAPIKNGFEAYYTLLDGFVFSGTTSSTILLNELSNFRFKADETPSELILRLEELFQDLQMLPGEAAMTFNDTQCINYLLGALRHEPKWDTVASAITSSQIKGDITFRQACDELRLRCEAAKAYQLIDKEVKGRRKVQGYQAIVVPDASEVAPVSAVSVPAPEFEAAVKSLISTMEKRINKKRGGKKKPEYEKRECLAKGCTNLSTFPLCGLHYHSVVSGKTPTLELRKEYGNAVYDAESKVVKYPDKVPAALLPVAKK